jgi:hypothetical protein
MLFSYPNVWNTCLLILRERGYHLYLTGDPDEAGTSSRCAWNAEKNGIKLRGASPIELLGLAGVYEYHRPGRESPYWWRVEGANIIAELEAEWRHVANADQAAVPDLPRD